MLNLSEFFLSYTSKPMLTVYKDEYVKLKKKFCESREKENNKWYGLLEPTGAISRLYFVAVKCLSSLMGRKYLVNLRNTLPF